MLDTQLYLFESKSNFPVSNEAPLVSDALLSYFRSRHCVWVGIKNCQTARNEAFSTDTQHSAFWQLKATPLIVCKRTREEGGSSLVPQLIGPPTVSRGFYVRRQSHLSLEARASSASLENLPSARPDRRRQRKQHPPNMKTER